MPLAKLSSLNDRSLEIEASVLLDADRSLQTHLPEIKAQQNFTPVEDSLIGDIHEEAGLASRAAKP